MKVNSAVRAFRPQRQRSLRSQITDAVRSMVTTGQLRPGDRLPSTQALAAEWDAQVRTVHDALTPLVKEGLLERTPRVGTFVRSQEERLSHVGIYVCNSLWTTPAFTFGRAVCKELHDQLAGLGIADSVWVDPRSPAEQSTAWDELGRAAGERRIQALLVPLSDSAHIQWLDKLPVPVVFLSTQPLPNKVGFDSRQWVETALTLLRDQGCHTVGAISANKVRLTAAGEAIEGHTEFYRQLRDVAKQLGLELRPEWILHAPPEGFGHNGGAVQQFGFEAMSHLCKLDKRPDGVAIYEDVTASGAIMAVMQERIDVPHDLKLALHRNAEIGLFCPFPAAFVDVRVADVAAAMIGHMRRLYDGVEVQSLDVPYHAVPASPSASRGADPDQIATAIPSFSELDYVTRADA